MVYASFRRRLGAFLLDSIAVSLIASFFYKLVPLFPVDWQAAGLQAFFTFFVIYYLVVTFLIMPLYWAFFESSPWQATLGKKALKIKVVDAHGQRLTFARAALREYTRIVSSMPMNLGYMLVFFSKYRQTVHDKIATTYVINDDAVFENGVPPQEPRNKAKMIIASVVYVVVLLSMLLTVSSVLAVLNDPEFWDAVQGSWNATDMMMKTEELPVALQ